MEIFWTQEAVNDLDDIHNFYFYKNPKTAKSIFNSIVDETQILVRFPLIGAAEPLLYDKPQTARSLLVLKKFKVVYYVSSEKVVITNVWDCRKNPERLQ